MKKCMNCGTDNDDIKTFCKKCGKLLIHDGTEANYKKKPFLEAFDWILIFILLIEVGYYLYVNYFSKGM